MSDTNVIKYRSMLDSAKSRYTGLLQKQAADEEAISGIKDPNCEGTVSIPGGDGSKPSLRNMPPNGSNTSGEEDKQHHIMDVTKPNGVGEGKYTVPRNGDARDAAATSPTAPLDKIAQLAGALSQAAAPAEKAATAAPTSVEPQMPAQLDDPDILSKLASIGAYMMGTEQGRQAVQNTIAREAGIKEAAAIVNAAGAMLKQAAAAELEPQLSEDDMKKIAAAKLAHESWLNQFETDLEKQAYMAGAADGDAMADAVEAGVDPTAVEEAADAGMSDEEVMGLLQEAMAQGLISEEEVNAILEAAAQGDADQSGDIGPEELLAILEQAIASGELDEATANQIAENYIAAMQGGAAAPEAEAGAEVPAEEEVKTAAAKSTQQVTDLINTLYATK